MEIIELKKGHLFDCIKRDGDLIDTHRNTQNAALNVDLFLYIYCLTFVTVVNNCVIETAGYRVAI